MLKTLIILAVLFTLTPAVYGQAPTRRADAAFAIGNGPASVSLSVLQTHPVAFKKRLSLGIGLRGTYHRHAQSDLITAPAHLTTGTQGAAVLFTPTRPAFLDTITVSASSITMVNIFIQIAYAIHDKWELGFNIDAVGFTAGESAVVSYESSRAGTGGFPSRTSASPTPWNVLLVSHNDIGSLQSELYVKYNWDIHLYTRLMYSYQFIEYTTSDRLWSSNNRFRYTPSLLGLAVGYQF
jgi:hypothetical protein